MINDKLKKAEELWGIKKDYNREAMPEVYQLTKECQAIDISIYRYNSQIKDYILEKERIDTDLIKMLDTEIYLSQKQIDREKTETHKNKMLADGWMPLDKEAIDKAIVDKKKLRVNATANNDWATIKIDKIYKPHIFNDNYGLMDLRAKTRGYYLNQFENAFCKLV